jgi:hypothetical protein
MLQIRAANVTVDSVSIKETRSQYSKRKRKKKLISIQNIQDELKKSKKLS